MCYEIIQNVFLERKKIPKLKKLHFGFISFHSLYIGLFMCSAFRRYNTVCV